MILFIIIVAINVLTGWFGYKYALDQKGQVTSTFWVITILTLLLGVILGWIIGFLIGQSKANELNAEEQRKRDREKQALKK